MHTNNRRDELEMEMSTPTRPLPCLAVEHGTGQSLTTVLFSVSGAGVLADLDEELKNKSLCPTPQGWILVRDRDSNATATTYLLDPHSRRKIQLPPLAIDQRLLAYCSCLLSGDPTAPGCVVLLVEPGATIIWYCQAGGEWTKHDYDIGIQGDEYWTEKVVIAPIAACRGKFYFNTTPLATTVLELRPAAAAAPVPVFSSLATDHAVAEERFGMAKVFLEESDEELYKVSVLHRGGAFDEARVYKMDFSEHRWHLVDDLGGRAFFVATLYFGASCFAGGEHGVRPDCVYSVVAVPKKSFRIFNVKDGTVELHNLEHATLETVGRSSWVVPTNPRA